MADIEKRSEPRRWRLQGGRISAEDGGFSLPCVIVNMSGNGARVRIEESFHLPERLYLIDTHENVAFQARVAWSVGAEFGLQLFQRRDLTTLPEGSDA